MDDIDISDLAGATVEHLQKIGQGFCGTVWASCHDADTQDSGLIIKREDGSPGRSLAHEHYMHRHVLTALQKHTEDVEAHNLITFRVNIPLSHSFLPPHSAFWTNILPKLPSGFTACNAFMGERIMPVPQKVRTLLAHKYYGSDDGELVAQDKANEHCLIRPYLGRRRVGRLWTRKKPGRLKVFSLRNFPLHMEQIEELGLPAENYAIAMADTLAFLHWRAKVDANDVEFVLARSRPMAQSSRPSLGRLEFTADALDCHAMWLFDFDCCNELDMNENGIEQAAKCFWRNDPYYPRPKSGIPEDEHLWRAFKARFLISSEFILRKEKDDHVRRLPGLLMKRIEETRNV